MEDILSVYKRPVDERFPQLCMDELTKQHLKDKRAPILPKPGRAGYHDYEYQRAGVSNVFMFFEPQTGWRHADVTERKTKNDWAWAMKNALETRYKDATKVILILDNLSTHKPESFYETFEPEVARALVEKLEFHYTPVHGSWLNMAEIALSALSRECLSRRIEDRQTLRHEVAAWEVQCNKNRAPVDWRFTTEDARIKLKRLYPVIATAKRSAAEH